MVYIYEYAGTTNKHRTQNHIRGNIHGTAGRHGYSFHFYSHSGCTSDPCATADSGCPIPCQRRG